MKSMQTAALYGKVSKLRRSLGGVMNEQGYQLSINGYGYLAGGTFYPSIEGTGDFGTLLPFDRNTSFWLRTADVNAFRNLISECSILNLNKFKRHLWKF